MLVLTGSEFPKKQSRLEDGSPFAALMRATAGALCDAIRAVKRAFQLTISTGLPSSLTANTRS